MPNWFVAKYDGECRNCLEAFYKGDDVAYFKDDLMHYICADECETEEKQKEWKDA